MTNDQKGPIRNFGIPFRGHSRTTLATLIIVANHFGWYSKLEGGLRLQVSHDPTDYNFRRTSTLNHVPTY